MVRWEIWGHSPTGRVALKCHRGFIRAHFPKKAKFQKMKEVRRLKKNKKAEENKS
jgi:hypothetical protein